MACSHPRAGHFRRIALFQAGTGTDIEGSQQGGPALDHAHAAFIALSDNDATFG
jgi:hypothetical protein